MAAAMPFTVKDVWDHPTGEGDHPTVLRADPTGHERHDWRSRYRSVLATNAHLFHGPDDHTPTPERAEFAAAAFQRATTPLMAPPYVAKHERVLQAAPRSDTRNRYQLVIDLALPTPAEPPYDCEQSVALTRLILGLPLLLELLPDPSYEDHAIPDVTVARQAARTLAHHASVITCALLGDLDG